MKRLIFLWTFFVLTYFAQAQSVDGGLKTLTASGTNTYTITEALPANYTINERFLVRFPNANTSTTVTLARAGLVAKNIYLAGGTSLAVGDIKAGGTYLLSYNGTYYQIVGGSGGGSSSSGTVTSIAAETGTSGSDFNVSGSPITTSGTIIFNLPTASGSVRGALSSSDWTTFNSKQSAITFGTGVQTALGVNIGSDGAPVLFNGALGTPSSGTLTNATGLPISTGVSGLGSGVATWLATPSWTNFNSAITGTAPFVSLATGGTATGTMTLTMGSNPFIFSTGVTTGTGATAGMQFVANSLTTGNGFDASSSSATTGFIGKFTSTSTVLDHTEGSNGILGVSLSGSNSTSSKRAIGLYSTVTNTGTSSTNIAGYFVASGGTNNYALKTGGGVIHLGNAASETITSSTRLEVRGTGTTSDLILRLASSANNTRWAIQSNGLQAWNATFTSAASNSTAFGASGTQTGRASNPDILNIMEMASNITFGANSQTGKGYVTSGVINDGGGGYTGLSFIAYDVLNTFVGTIQNKIAFRAPSGTGNIVFGKSASTASTKMDLVGDGTSTANTLRLADSGDNATFLFKDNGDFQVTKTVTAGGTTGNQTINKLAGTVNFAASATTLTVTNSLVTTSSIVFCVVRTNDTTATIKNVVPGSGSFVITLTAAATAETSVGFFVVN